MNDPESRDAAHWDAVEDATELLREGDHDGALEALREALTREPANPYAHYFTGAVLFEKGEFALAAAAYERAIAHAPGYLGAVLGLGHAQRMQGRLDEAIRTGERALLMVKDARTDLDVHYLLGLTYAQKGDERRAVRHLQAVLDARPEVELKHEVEGLIQTLTGGAKPLDIVPGGGREDEPN